MRVVEDDIKDTFNYVIHNDKNTGCGRIYQTSNEEIEELYSNVDFKDKKVLSVLASGDQSFMAYLNGANKVDVFDINKLTIYYYYLRIWAMRYFHTFYPEPYLSRDYVNALLSHVKPKNEIEERCIKYWKEVVSRIKEYQFLMMFFSKSTVIQLDDEKIDRLSGILANNKPKFYNVDIAKENDIDEKYDIVITSNIVDWVCSEDGNLSEYKKNISKLLKPKGIVLSSNISHERPNPLEREFFDKDFDYYEIFGNSNNSLEYSPGYMYVKR